MVHIDYRADRAVLSVCGDITDELAIDLVAQMRRQADERFYNLIELEITSNGGQATALRYFIEALDRFRSEGVSVTTRALTRASSAAAIMLSLGSWREAAPGADLLYHSMRAGGLESVTSMSAAALHGVLSSADSRMMRRLAERGLQANLDSLPPLGEAAEGLSPGDWLVVHRLLAASEGAAEDAGTRPADWADGPAALERLRGVVAKRARDAASLGRLYGALFELDASISAALAKELLLVDAAVAPGGAAKPSGVAGGCFRIPEWRAAFRPDGRLDRRVLCRHVLILGETGSGKTASGVLPVVAAMFDPRNPFGCALVVDPKREIGASLDALARTGDVEVRVFEPGSGPDAPTLNLMSGPEWSVSEDMEAGRFMAAARKILIRSASLSAASPGGMLAGELDACGREIYWPNEGARLAQTALALTLMLIARRREVFAGLDSAAPRRNSGRSAFDALREFGEEAGFLPARDDLRQLADEARADAESLLRPDEDDEDEEDGEDAIAEWRKSVAAAALRFVRKLRANPARWESPAFGADFRRIARKLLDRPANSALLLAADELDRAAVRCADDANLSPSPSVLAMGQKAMQSMFRPDKAGGECALPAATLAKELRPMARGGEDLDLLDRIEKHWLPMVEIDSPGQYIGVMGYGQQCFLEFGDAPASRMLYFGVEPRPAGSALDFSGAVDDERRRAIFLVQPRLGKPQDGIIAKALKAQFFEAVLNSPERQRRGGEMPLVGYVADECHRFVTSDRTHGEQSFLDTCRSFGAFCVLACQSASSLEHALVNEGGGKGIRAALSILLNNTATKLTFRSTDEATRERLRALCPAPCAGPKVTEVRPPSTLRPGECYAATADGRFERRQLEAFDLERAAQRIKPEARPDAAPRPSKGGKHGPDANGRGRAEASRDL